MSRASQHPSERDRSGLQMAMAALERRESIYPGAASIPRLLLEQINNPHSVIELSYDALLAENATLRADRDAFGQNAIDLKVRAERAEAERNQLRTELDEMSIQKAALELIRSVLKEIKPEMAREDALSVIRAALFAPGE